MKANKLLIPILTASLFATAANAQVDLTITGSTAWRAIALDRVKAMFDAGSTNGFGDIAAATGPGTIVGTISNATANAILTPVTIRFSFSGSASGMTAVKNQTTVATWDPVGNTNGQLKVPDLAFSDVYPESASPPISGGSFNDTIVGAVPFVYVCNNNLYNQGITNITREQAVLLMTASGDVGLGGGGMKATFLGGTSTDPVFMTGRDTGSGTRITIHKNINLPVASAVLALDVAGNLTLTGSAYSSGGTEREFIRTNANAIGYLGLSDANNAGVAAAASKMRWQGQAYSAEAVKSGAYPLWGYEHFVNRTSMSGQALTVRNTIIAGLNDVTYQSTNPAYTNVAVEVSLMKVFRTVDGGTIKVDDFSTY